MKKSVGEGPFYGLSEGPTHGSGGVTAVLDPTSATAGPWTSEAQHGGPPAALLAWAVETLPAAAGTVVGRFTMELWGPIPLTPLRVSAHVVRPGRSVILARAELVDVRRERVVATAQVWLFPASSSGPGAPSGPLPHGPGDGVRHERPTTWGGGYLDAIDWRWITGAVDRPGPGVVWMRSPDLVAGTAISPVQRLLACVDSASGAGAALDVADWAFLNTDLTVHLLRPPVGEWVCLDARTTLGPGSVGVATCDVHDELGVVARSAQALLVARR
ncbi:thioesterase family protein [Nocardioides sp.]|uniref:thioesterase family protein n=1 Tax=Nocardioides sp. TaxID=35761 RepID=UPI000C8BD49C|nr:TesB-like acyl-CoA thioesterase 5 [Pimelobacter sp.]